MAGLRVMTFNVRQMDGDDGGQAWEHRRDVLVDTVQRCSPALLGTQETFEEQTAYILAHCPNLLAFGCGRYGDDRDKHNKIFYDPRRIELLEAGEIWISKTPDIAGSSDWEILSPRMISWGMLRIDGVTNLMVMNTHFPYGPSADEARRQTVRLILEKIAELPVELPIILMGDFNAKAGSEVYQLLTATLSDAWNTAETTVGPEGTVHGFGRITGSRIDWILYRHIGRVFEAETVTYTARGLFPSDHYPVCATLEL